MEICTDPVTSRRRSCFSCSIFGSLPPNTIESQLRTLYSHFFALILAVLSDSERETTAPQTQIPLTEKATAAGNPFPGGAQLATEEKTVVGGGGDDDARARHMCDVQYFPR